AFFALFLATFAPIRAQESASTDENAGIMLAASSGVAFTSLEAYARDLAGLVEVNGYTYDTTYYELGLVNLPDPGSYDCWLWAGGLLHSITSSSGTVSRGGFLFQGVVVRLANGNWASTDGIGSANVAHGYWPVYFRVNDGAFTSASFYGTYANTGDITVQDAANFMSNLRSFLDDVKNLAITGAVVDSLDVARLNDFETYDADGGGVIDLVEWVRGGDLNDWIDDVPSFDSACKCGACCSCECVCGKWSGSECGGTPDDCKCHKPDETCTCGDYCCLHICECGAHLPGEAHENHKNGKPGCDETDGEDGCDCHQADDPDEEECTCANYCCACKCECKKCKAAGACSGTHKNGDMKCDGVSSGSTYCCDCHDSGDEEECTCENYCCACTCECKKCKAAGACSGNHKNGDMKCDGVSSGSTYCCDCHKTDNPEETPCTCANYCCYHTCECKSCASLPAEKHSQHKNGYPTCTGTTGSGGCSCHEEDVPEDDFPEGDVPTASRNDTFIENTEFNEHYRRLSDALEQKFGFSIFQRTFGSFQGDAKLPTFQTPRIFDRTGVTIDLNKAAENKTLATLRGILVAAWWFFTFAHIFHSVRKVFG
ncbi:MAG: hypothetical protein IJ387_02475, partial [Thermoguttaceae bacterium]|nr:hypothetical protein [Thermoguttaceae bacterium]